MPRKKKMSASTSSQALGPSSKRYTPEQKAQALALVEERGFAQTHRITGITPASLRTWRTEANNAIKTNGTAPTLLISEHESPGYGSHLTVRMSEPVREASASVLGTLMTEREYLIKQLDIVDKAIAYFEQKGA